MGNKPLGKKKYAPTFFQRNKKRIYAGSLIGLVLILLLVNNRSLLFGKGDNEGSLPFNYAGSMGMNPVEAPNFKLETIFGNQLKLSDYRGKVIIVDFWATWCSPCRRGIPDLIELKRKYGNQGFEVIGISVDTDTKADVVPFVKENGINYPVVYAADAVAERYGGISSIPTSFVIDKNGKIAASYVGLTSISEYEGQINKLLIHHTQESE